MLKQLPYKILYQELISVDFNDKFIRSIDKWKAHSHKYLKEPNSMPHRAFSIFLFNSNNDLLLQRRSASKKTFPLCWTNTCCSHPNMIQLFSLHRALDRQLRMNLKEEQFYFYDKFLYKAYDVQQQVGYGQYEVDYVFVCKLKTPNISYELIKSEVMEVEWVSRSEMTLFLEKKQQLGQHFSPWFKLILQNNMLNKWWNQVESNSLKNQQNQDHFEVKMLLK